MTDTLIQPMADELLACFCAALTTEFGSTTIAQGGLRPTECCMRVGEIVSMDASVYEDVCCTGLAWLRVVDIFASSNDFPAPDTTIVWTGCGPVAWGVVFELGVARCAPTGTIDTIPTCDDWTALQSLIMRDAKAMRQAFCCLFSQLDPSTVAVGSWAPLPTSGGCAGGTWQVSVQIQNTECCE
jgi:hypothetical protein